ALPGVFVDHAQHLQGASVDHLVVDEVVTPDRIRANRARQADVVAGTAAARPAAGNVQTQLAPQAPHPGLAQVQPGRHAAIPEPRHFGDAASSRSATAWSLAAWRGAELAVRRRRPGLGGAF